jgi:hypothetical protein
MWTISFVVYKFKKFTIGVDQSARGISPYTFCKTAVAEVERKLSEVGQKLTTCVYLGADVKKFMIGVDQSTWGISPDTYCKTAVVEVKRKLKPDLASYY